MGCLGLLKGSEKIREGKFYKENIFSLILPLYSEKSSSLSSSTNWREFFSFTSILYSPLCLCRYAKLVNKQLSAVPDIGIVYVCPYSSKKCTFVEKLIGVFDTDENFAISRKIDLYKNGLYFHFRLPNTQGFPLRKIEPYIQLPQVFVNSII